MNRNIKRRSWKGSLFPIFVALAFLQGCASAPVQPTCLVSTAPLVPDPEDTSLLWWEKPGFNWHDYRQIMLDPVVVHPDILRASPELTEKALDDLKQEFRRAVIVNLQPDYPVANQPGPTVLRIRAAIVHIDQSNPALNLLTTATVFVPLDMGGASIEVEFLDSMTGERLAAMADRKTGTPAQLAGSFSRFGHTRQAFDQWALALKTALEANP